MRRRRKALVAPFLCISLVNCLSATNAVAAAETVADQTANWETPESARTDSATTESATTESPFRKPTITLGDSVSQLSDQIAAKEFELLRMNTNYRIESTRVSPWRARRQALFGLGQYGCSNAGIDLITYVRWHYWRFPKRAPRRLQQAGPLLLLIGHSIGLGGLVIETAFDAAADYQRRRKGFDRKQFLHHTAEVERQLDGLIAQREQALTSLSAQERSVADAETAVLKDLRDTAIEENTKLNVRAARWKAARNTNTIMTAAGLATGGYIGALMSLLGINEHKPRFVGPAGIGFTLSGALIALTPFASRANSALSGKFARNQTEEQLGIIPQSARASLAADQLKLKNVVDSSANDVRLSNRLQVYDLGGKALGIQSDLAKAEAKQANKDFAERVVAASIIGGTKMGYGIQLMNAGFGYHKPIAKPPVKFKLPVGGTKVTFTKPVPRGANELFARRVAEAATTFLPGTAYGIFDILQSRIRGEIKTAHDSAAGTSPTARLKSRMQLLDQADGLLRNPKISSSENPTLD